jgi:hypothetical protein
MKRKIFMNRFVQLTIYMGIAMVITTQGSMGEAVAQPQTLRMGGADVPVMPNPENRVGGGTIPGTTFAAFADTEKQREAYEKWVALIPKILDGFDKEWIFDFPSVVREFQLWAGFSDLSRYRSDRVYLTTALLPGLLGSTGIKGNRDVDASFAHGLDRPELQWFSPPRFSAVVPPGQCIDIAKLFHGITQRTGVGYRLGVRSPASHTTGDSTQSYVWTVPRNAVEGRRQNKELVVSVHGAICAVNFRVELIPVTASGASESGGAK